MYALDKYTYIYIREPLCMLQRGVDEFIVFRNVLQVNRTNNHLTERLDDLDVLAGIAGIPLNDIDLDGKNFTNQG